MAFEYPSERMQDWLSQRWVMWRGRPIDPGQVAWLMGPHVDEQGNFELVSSGDGFGCPGFYFLLHDAKGRYWAQYIKTFRERIGVYVDEESVLRTDHLLRLWGRTVLHLHYKILPRRAL